jgi:hypothetical protein
MIYLNTNQAGQTLYLTLQEMRPHLPVFTHYLFVLTYDEHGAGADNTACIALVDYENYRITKLDVDTTGALLEGQYQYRVYGQNSASNLNPNNAAVVGLVEQGKARLSAAINYYTAPNITIPTNVNYQG